MVVMLLLKGNDGVVLCTKVILRNKTRKRHERTVQDVHAFFLGFVAHAIQVVLLGYKIFADSWKDKDKKTYMMILSFSAELPTCGLLRVGVHALWSLEGDRKIQGTALHYVVSTNPTLKPQIQFEQGAAGCESGRS
jgi:hypothetical protein